MKFTLLYKREDGTLIGENYRNVPGRFGRGEIETIEDAYKWGQKIIDWYNETLRDNEKARKFFGVTEGHWAKEINIEKLNLDEITTRVESIKKGEV